MRVICLIVAIFCLADCAIADVQEERRKYAQARFKQLRKQIEEKPVFQYVGVFKDGTEKDAPDVVLVVKIEKMCKKEQPCTPMIWQQKEKNKLVQYEIHNCYCDKADRIAAAKERQKERHVAWLKKQRERKEEDERWQKKRRQRIREAALQIEVRRLQRRYDYSYICSQYPRQRHRYSRYCR